MTAMPRKLQARLPRGLRDLSGQELQAQGEMLRRLGELCVSWGFAALDTPILEYADALGKFLPDEDRPNAGVFSLQDEDERWLALRYDLTAPLARYVASNYDTLPKPFRRYQYGTVFRNEKPDSGRYRQFVQFDADVVGAPAPLADAEICALAAACLNALGLQGKYALRISSRKLLDGLLENLGMKPGDSRLQVQRLRILRSIDKLDRLGLDGVKELLRTGRKDASGDFTEGAELDPEALRKVLAFLESGKRGNSLAVLDELENLVQASATGKEGVQELRDMRELMQAFGVAEGIARIDTSVVRGLDYYTGPIFEVELGGKDKRLERFGSVGGGGRYDNLVTRFKDMEIPATGFSIGISRLFAALRAVQEDAPVAMLKPEAIILLPASAHKNEAAGMAQELRQAGIRAEVYIGGGGMRSQMRYADRINAKIVVIQGMQERDRGEVTLRNLVLGKKLSESIKNPSEWKKGGDAQIHIPREELIDGARAMLRSVEQAED